MAFSLSYRQAYHTVLPTKTSLIVQLVHWDVPSFPGFLFSVVPCSMSCHFSGFHCSVHVAGEFFITLPVPLILIFPLDWPSSHNSLLLLHL